MLPWGKSNWATLIASYGLMRARQLRAQAEVLAHGPIRQAASAVWSTGQEPRKLEWVVQEGNEDFILRSAFQGTQERSLAPDKCSEPKPGGPVWLTLNLWRL